MGTVGILVLLHGLFRYSFSEAIYRYFTIALKVIYPYLIAIKFSSMIEYRLKFVKM